MYMVYLWFMRCRTTHISALTHVCVLLTALFLRYNSSTKGVGEGQTRQLDNLLDVIRILQPLYTVTENVANLCSGLNAEHILGPFILAQQPPKKGKKGKTGKMGEKGSKGGGGGIGTMCNPGYDFQVFVTASWFFGVAQWRGRCIVIGNLHGIAAPVNPPQATHHMNDDDREKARNFSLATEITLRESGVRVRRIESAPGGEVKQETGEETPMFVWCHRQEYYNVCDYVRL